LEVTAFIPHYWMPKIDCKLFRDLVYSQQWGLSIVENLGTDTTGGNKPLERESNIYAFDLSCRTFCAKVRPYAMLIQLVNKWKNTYKHKNKPDSENQ